MRVTFERVYRVRDYSVFLFDAYCWPILSPIFQAFFHIRSLILLLCTLLMSAVFLLTKNGDYLIVKKRFPFSNIEITRDTYWYFLFEHIILVMFAVDRLLISKKFRTALIIFVMIQVIDTVDYLLFYGQTWFFIGYMPINWNILKVVFFTLAIMNEIIIFYEQKWKSF